MIKIYGKHNCKGCTQVKMFLDANQVPYEYLNTDENPTAKQEVIDMGVMALPVVVIGQDHYVGWSDTVREKLGELI